MTLRVAAIVMVLVNVAVAISCIAITVREAVARADVVFRGTVAEIHDAPRDKLTDILQPRKRIAVFRVDRVWKGDVGDSFEIPLPGGIYPDWGSFASIGNELLVYARRLPGSAEYTTSVCFRTAPANGSKDFQELGTGKPAVKKSQQNANQP